MLGATAKYQVLLKINNAIISRYSEEGLFQTLAAELGELFHYDRFSINLYDPKTNTLHYFATADGVSPEKRTGKVRVIEKGSVAELVIQSRKPVFFHDVSKYPQMDTVKWMLEAGLISTMAFPMIIRDTVLGSIHIFFKKVPANVRELYEFMNDLSVQIAIAVDNMLSYVKLKRKKENLEQEKRYLIDNTQNAYQYQRGNFYYKSESISKIMEEIDIVAETHAPVLITGETGTGKGHIARYIHNLSPRRDRLFVHVNCAALAPTLIESELFGHTKGAFTGASGRRVGRFEIADKGTILLDEIGELPLHIQAKLLQVLQDKTFEPVGKSTPLSVDIRIIAASNKDIKAAIHEKTFREDLYYRINTVHVHIPALRERIEDIPLLVGFFTSKYAEKMRRPQVQYTSSAMYALCYYSWPGNVRELENVIERLMILRAGDMIDEKDITTILNIVERREKERILTRSEMEKKHIEEALAKCGGIVGGPNGAAHLLGMRRTTLQYRMKKLGLHPSDSPKKSNDDDKGEIV